MEEHDGKKRSSFATGIVVGALGGLVVSICAGLPVGYTLVKKKEADVRRGWNLMPVVIAAQDIPEGTVVTYDMISQRSVPEQFVTDSLVKPDTASYIVNQPILVPVHKGDPLRWSDFEATKKP